MKILQVIPCFSPPLLFGGSQTVVWNISKELIKRGHQVKVYSSNMINEWYSFPLPRFEIISGIEIYRFRNVSKLLSKTTRYILTPDILFNLRAEVKKLDIIHLHELRNFPQLITALCSARAEKPFVIQAHGTLLVSSHLMLKNMYDKTLLKYLFSKAEKIIAVNEFEKKQILSYGVPSGKIAIIPNAINLDEFFNLPQKGSFRMKYGLTGSDFVILYLGRIARDKGADILIKAISGIRNRYNNVKLVVAGPDDGFLPYVVKLVRKLNLQNITIFTGPLRGRDKLGAYVDADIYVLPSRYEIWGMTILEAYACAKPVIASRVGGVPQMVKHGITGFLFESGNSEELGSYLAHFIENRSLIKEMGSRGREFVIKNYSIGKVVDKLEKLYFESIR
jgi:glycosyltransferase involved in cell wall biosynthesis